MADQLISREINGSHTLEMGMYNFSILTGSIQQLVN